jgi:hypothetical protein
LIASVQSVWNKTFPGYDFNYFFLDQDFEKQYQSEQRLANVFTLFAVITIIIAAIGLVGLVSFMVVSKTKEIGVRKVLGAGVMNITKLLSKEFIILVVIANVIIDSDRLVRCQPVASEICVPHCLRSHAVCLDGAYRHHHYAYWRLGIKQYGPPLLIRLTHFATNSQKICLEVSSRPPSATFCATRHSPSLIWWACR